MTYYDLTAKLFFQIAIIIIVCRIVVLIGKKYLYQTEVVCEMLAGFILGPSIFGLLFPQTQQLIFPSDPYVLVNGTVMPNQSMSLLFAISQIGVVLYMFLTGLDFEIEKIHSYIKPVILTSTFGIIVPFILGMIFISSIKTDDLIPAGIPMTIAMVYFGSAISMTAFPVLLRILEEKELLKTPLGRLATASGSLADAIAWCMVALVLTLTKHDPLIILITVGGTILYIVFMIYFGHFLRKIFFNHFHENVVPSKQILSFVLIILMFCAVAVDKIGLYSAFGAFLAGAIMPKGKFASSIKKHFNYLPSALLLPIFFTFTGLSSHINLINTFRLIMLTIAITLLAIFSKLIICTISARIAGMNWRLSAALGLLMNTKGLIELIILNIGLHQGIITPTLFTMMVLMTLITTMMTSPFITLILNYRRPAKIKKL